MVVSGPWRGPLESTGPMGWPRRSSAREAKRIPMSWPQVSVPRDRFMWAISGKSSPWIWWFGPWPTGARRPVSSFSWDDFDSFRKIPAGLPHPQKMEAFLHRPLVDVPDPYGKEASYAQGREKAFEAELARVGVAISPLYQGQKYRDGEYGQQIHRAPRMPPGNSGHPQQASCGGPGGGLPSCGHLLCPMWPGRRHHGEDLGRAMCPLPLHPLRPFRSREPPPK